MGTAVVRIVVDAAGRLSPAEYARGVQRLQEDGHEVIATPPEHLPERAREIEFIVPEGDVPLSAERFAATCTAVFGIPAAAGVVTYISRGTDGDARGVLRRFNLTGEVERSFEDGEEIVTVVLPGSELAKVSESRLHTAMEAALNVEVRIRAAEG